MPWVFVLGMAAGTMLPVKRWVHGPAGTEWDTPAARDASTIVKRSEASSGRHPVDVLYGIDGDTFAARVHLEPGIDLNTRIRLRGIDAPELKGQCAQEIRMAEAAGNALNRLLRDGAVTIYNIGPDRYPGRVVADVATTHTPNVSAALLGSGHVRSYTGGHRSGWCGARS
jgi:endonuclease YncB( thermonuclease family)